MIVLAVELLGKISPQCISRQLNGSTAGIGELEKKIARLSSDDCSSNGQECPPLEVLSRSESL